jgi:hypothetical protein
MVGVIMRIFSLFWILVGLVGILRASEILH